MVINTRESDSAGSENALNRLSEAVRENVDTYGLKEPKICRTISIFQVNIKTLAGRRSMALERKDHG